MEQQLNLQEICSSALQPMQLWQEFQEMGTTTCKCQQPPYPPFLILTHMAVTSSRIHVCNEL